MDRDRITPREVLAWLAVAVIVAFLGVMIYAVVLILFLFEPS